MIDFFFSSRRRHTRCALVTGVQTVLFRSAWRDGARRAWAVMIVAFGVFLCEAGLGSQALSMELNRDNLPSYATCFLVFLVCMAIGRKGHSWPVSYLGVLSYPLYLLHQNIGQIGRAHV